MKSGSTKCGGDEKKTKTKEAKKKCKHFGVWLPDAAHADGERSVGVTVSNCVNMGGFSPPVVVTVEVYGLGTDDEKDEDCPETWGGSESATLTPDGARELAALLLKHADQADALQRKDLATSKAKQRKKKER